ADREPHMGDFADYHAGGAELHLPVTYLEETELSRQLVQSHGKIWRSYEGGEYLRKRVTRLARPINLEPGVGSKRLTEERQTLDVVEVKVGREDVHFQGRC